MSNFIPKKMARKFREFQDNIIEFSSQPAVLYRYEGQVSTATTAPNPADEFLEKNHRAETRNIFSDPIQTQIRVNWPESLNVTREGNIDIDDEDQITGRVKFDDHPTIESYFKTPIINALDADNIGNDVYSEVGEENLVVRLEIVRPVTDLEDNTAELEADFAIKRTDDHLADSDTGPLADVDESRFFV